MSYSMNKAEQLVSVLRKYGVDGTKRRLARKLVGQLNSRWNLPELDFPLRQEDLVDPSDHHYTAPQAVAGERLKIGWVCIAPRVGSGGHTTFFRMVQAAQDAGHDCTLVLYDKDDDDVSRRHEAIRRGWPWLSVPIESAAQIDERYDALVASSWPTAHVIAARAPRNARQFYFVQDYEPYFYPRGYLYQLAEDSYRLGLHTIALGHMVASELSTAAGITPDIVVPFGCDSETYFLQQTAGRPPRTGVVYYVRRDNDRRGYQLAKAALERFHQLCPDQEIHLYGDRVSGWSIPVTDHGNLSPQDLNELYNRTIGSIAMSFTNISLVASELLAAGNIPVLNESATARQDASHAVWAAPAPAALAEALAEVVRHPDIEGRAAQAAAKVPASWRHTAELTVAEIADACLGARERLQSVAGEPA